MKIVICDDEKIYVENISKIINNHIKNADIVYYNNIKDIANCIKDDKNISVYILDIEFGQDNINGMDIAKVIRKKDKDAIIIFLTNYDKYVYDAYEVMAFRYIPKCRINEKLPLAIRDAVLKIKESYSKNIYIGAYGKTIRRIEHDEIIYIEKYQKNIVMYLKDNTVVKERMTLKNIYNDLDPHKFIFANKGTIVNLKNIKALDGLMLLMENGYECYISRERLRNVKEKITDFWG